MTDHHKNDPPAPDEPLGPLDDGLFDDEPIELVEADEVELIDQDEATERIGFDNRAPEEEAEEFTWNDMALDEAPAASASDADRSEIFEADDGIFDADRTESDVPPSAVNLTPPNIPPTLAADDYESDSDVSIDKSPSDGSGVPLRASQLYGADDREPQPSPPEPIEFGAGAEEIDFNILHTEESASGLVSHSRGTGGESGVRLGESPSAVDSESSIFREDAGLLPTAPGSGWFDSPRSAAHSKPPLPAPPSSRTEVGQDEPPHSGGSISDLYGVFARGPATPNVPIGSGWIRDDNTGTVTESEVLKAFDQLARSAPAKPETPSSQASSDALTHPTARLGPDGEGSNLFPQPESDEYQIEILGDGQSGVDLMHHDGQNDTGGPKSSIFSHPPAHDDATAQYAFDEELEVDPVVGSSIFEQKELGSHWGDDDKTAAVEPEPVIEEFDEHSKKAVEDLVGGIDWDKLEEANDQVSMRMPKRGDSFADIDELFFAQEPASATVLPETEIPPPDSASNFVGVEGSITAADSGIYHGDDISPVVEEPQRAEPVRPKRKAEAPPPKRKGSMVGWIGGGIAGVVIGAGGFGAAYLADLLPNGGAAKPIAIAPVAKTDPEPVVADPKVAEELQAALAKVADTEKRAKEEAEAASKQLRESSDANIKLRDDADEAKTSLVKTRKALAAATATAEKAKTDATTAKAESEKAADALKLAMLDSEKATKDLVDVKKTLDDKLKALADAEALAADVEKKRKGADDALAGVVKEMKAAKLIPDADEQAAALAKIPDVLKSAATAMTSSDAKKAAEALTQAKADLDAAKLNMKKAEEAVTLAKTEAKDAMTAAEKAKAEAAKMVADAKKEIDDKVAVAVKNAEMATKKQLDDAMAAVAAAEAKRAADAKAREAEVKALADAHAKELIEARSGAVVLLTTPESAAIERAYVSYGRGMNAYSAGRFDEAEKAFATATADFPSDARYWYYLGLAQYRQSKVADAETSFKKGADLERRNLPGRATVNEDLQRIQGKLRTELSKFRP